MLYNSKKLYSFIIGRNKRENIFLIINLKNDIKYEIENSQK